MISLNGSGMSFAGYMSTVTQLGRTDSQLGNKYFRWHIHWPLVLICTKKLCITFGINSILLVVRNTLCSQNTLFYDIKPVLIHRELY